MQGILPGHNYVKVKCEVAGAVFNIDYSGEDQPDHSDDGEEFYQDAETDSD
jgi:hypothetical protein